MIVLIIFASVFGLILLASVASVIHAARHPEPMHRCPWCSKALRVNGGGDDWVNYECTDPACGYDQGIDAQERARRERLQRQAARAMRYGPPRSEGKP